MENTIRVFQIVHRVSLAVLLLLIATVPLITEVNTMTAFVILPTALIILFTMSIIIDQRLTTLSLATLKPKKNNMRIYRKCYLKNCLS